MTTNYTPVVAVPATITLPVDGEDVVVESINLPLRQVADRTASAFDRLDDAEGRLDDAEAELTDHASIRDLLWSDGGEISYVTPRERSKTINMTKALPLSAGWTMAAHVWSCNTANASIYVPIELPHGAHFRRVRVAVQLGNTSEAIGVYLLRYGPYGFTVGPFTPPSVDQIITGSLSGGAAGDRIFVFDTTGGGFDTLALDERAAPHGAKAVVANDLYSYTLQVFTAGVKTVADKLYGVQVIFTDPGFSGR